MARTEISRWARATSARTRSRLRGNDLLLLAGGVTFYAALAMLPGLFVALRLAALMVGREHVLHLGTTLAAALPGELGAPGVALALVRRGVDLSWWNALVSVLPASLYGEGLRRALTRLRGSGRPAESFVGWRGRFAVLPVLAVAPGLLLLLLVIAARVGNLFERGGWGAVLAVVVAFTADWLLLCLPLVWVFRVVAPDPPSWPAAAVGGVLTASFVAGFLQGFVLFLSLPLDLGTPFGGLAAVGGAVAVLLWLWVLHLVVLVGFAVTGAGERSAGRAGQPRPQRPARTPVGRGSGSR